VQRRSPDPIALELFRTYLAAVAEEGFQAIVRTATSPVVTEALDCSSSILDRHGRLLCGGGRVAFHYWAAVNNVASLVSRHEGTISEGDVFIGNDPHADAAVHPQDVMISQPVFLDGVLIGWVVNGAHMIDVGGMTFGSYSNDAVECFQEALRLPPVKLFAEGREQSDIWQIIRTNVRLPNQLEMDLRGLIAGCHAAASKLIALADRLGGPDLFDELTEDLYAAVGAHMRERLLLLEDGEYETKAWTEWVHELYAVPCRLTVSEGELLFDFEGASPQTTHLFNSKPWIVQAVLGPLVRAQLVPQIPLSHAVFEAVRVLCPKKSVLNCEPPAPIGAAHVDACGAATAAAISTLNLALSATYPPDHFECAGAPLATSTAMHLWTYRDGAGVASGCVVVDGTRYGGSAWSHRDGDDFVDMACDQDEMELIDVEIFESLNPLLVLSKKRRTGLFGAGSRRGGAGCQMRVRPHGTKELIGVMLGKRAALPAVGIAGGGPSSTTQFSLFGTDGKEQRVAARATDVTVRSGDHFEFSVVGGPGYGDPLDRLPHEVLSDVVAHRISMDEAEAGYGVVIKEVQVDENTTEQCRTGLREARLRDATPPAQVRLSHEVPSNDETVPLYPGVVQRGAYAIAEESGAVLAEAPSHWTDGCAVLRSVSKSDVGEVLVESYLDPITGRRLLVDVRPSNEARTVTSMPRRWSQARQTPLPG
jgi:N-methylhydantoinase B